jgi:hypothetical protein
MPKSVINESDDLSRGVEVSLNAETVPWQELLARTVHLPFPFAWLLAALILILVGGYIVLFLEHDPSLFPMVVLSALLIAAEANVVLLFYKMFVGSALPSVRPALMLSGEELSNWELQQIRSVFSSKINLGLGFILVLIVVSISFLGGMVFRTIPGLILHGMLFFLIGLTGGSLLYVILALGLFSHRLGKTRIMRISVFCTRTKSIKAISIFMLQVCLIVVLVYLLGICLMPFIKHKQGPIQIGFPVGFGIFLFAYFIFSQWSIHCVIRDAKLQKLEALVPTMEECFDAVSQDLSRENLARLSELFELQRNIYARPSWGFGAQEMIALLSSIIVPIIIYVLKLVI